MSQDSSEAIGRAHAEVRRLHGKGSELSKVFDAKALDVAQVADTCELDLSHKAMREQFSAVKVLSSELLKIQCDIDRVSNLKDAEFDIDPSQGIEFWEDKCSRVASKLHEAEALISRFDDSLAGVCTEYQRLTKTK